ncbi:helix-turn-helix domain-containing protein [Streptomyces sp. NPDC059373]
MTQSADPAEKHLAARVGAGIRALREKAGLSTRQLAKAAGISQAFLSQIERGLSAPSMATTYRLAEALEVVPGALLPPMERTSPVTFVPAVEGRTLPVADREGAAVGRALMMDPGKSLEVIEYVIEPGQYIQEWFQLEGELAVYLVSGALDVEVEGEGTWRLGPRDLIAHPAGIRHRWLLVENQPAHVLFVIAHPEGGKRRAT